MSAYKKCLMTIGVVCISVGLVGCLGSDQDELSEWIDAERRSVVPNITPVNPPKQFVAASYDQGGAVDPFKLVRLTDILKKDSSQNTGAALIAAEEKRAKEPLESFPLDVMSMVGSILKDGRVVGLIKVDDLLHQVVVGNHLGQNYGRIISIEEGQITLREIVQDSLGEWIEKITLMQLQENVK